MRALCRLALLIVATHNLSSQAQEPAPGERLRLFSADTSAQIGWYGDPALSEWRATQQLQWSPGGYALSTHIGRSTRNEIVPFGYWQVDASSQRLVCRGQLDAGGVMCQSTKGDLLCVQLRRKETDPDKDPSLADDQGAFCCYRWPDRKRQWMVKPEKGEEWCSAAFSRDDRYVIVFLIRAAQGQLLLLDAVSGKEQQRAQLPGITNGGYGTSLDSLVATHDGGLLLRSTHDGMELDEFSVAAFQPHKLDGVINASAVHRMVVARHADVVGFFGADYVVIQKTATGWHQAIAGELHPAYETDRIHNLALSPDGTRALVFSDSQAKLIDPLNKKVISATPRQMLAAAFSPDGRFVAVVREGGTETWKAADGTVINDADASPQHHAAVNWMHYMPDGKSLLVGDHDAVLLWDTATRKVLARMVAVDHEGSCPYKFPYASLIQNSTECIAPDGLNYLRWHLPSLGHTAPAKSLEIKAEQAFPGVPKQKDKGKDAHRWMASALDRSGRWLLTFETAGGFKGKAALRDLKNPSVVTDVKLPVVMFGSKLVSGYTMKDGEILIAFPGNNDRWFLVRPDAPEATEYVAAKGTRWGTPIAFMPIRQAGVHLDRSTMPLTVIHLVSMATGEVLKSLDTGAMKGPLTEIVAVSPDEKWVASIGNEPENSITHLLVWDAESGNLVANQILPSYSAEALAFSADSTKIACAHHHHAISEWDLAKMQISAKPASNIPKETANSVVTNAQKPALKDLFPKRLSALPAEGRVDATNVKWQFNANGEVGIGESLTSAGQLAVNGRGLKSEGVLILAYPSSRFFHDTMATECSALDGQLWISRYFSRPQMWNNAPTFVDTLHNLGTKELRFTIAFMAGFPSDTKVLMDSDFHAVTVAGDGRLNLDPKALWVAPSNWGKPGDDLPIFRFRNLSSPVEAKVFWDAKNHVLRSEYEVVLSPGSHKYLMHQFQRYPRDPKSMPNSVSVPWAPDFSSFVLPVVRDLGINFGRLRAEFESPFSFNHMDEWAFEPRSKDAAGFVWTGLPGMGMQGEMGAVSLNLMQIDDRPLPFCGPSVYPSAQNAHTVEKLNDKEFREARSITGKQFVHPDLAPSTLGASNLDRSVEIIRRPSTANSFGDTLWSDYINNLTDTPRTLTVSYVSTFRAAPIAVWDGAGHAVHPASMPDVKSLGGMCAVELEGKQRPATLLQFYGEGAPLEPKLRWLSDRTLSVDFQVVLPARARRRIVLLAGQRLLDTVTDLVSAFVKFASESPHNREFPYRGPNPLLPLNYSSRTEH